MKHITSIKKYFTKKDKKFIFTGKEMIVNVPKFYSNYGYFINEDIIKVLGILQLIFDNKEESKFIFTNIIETIPSDINEKDDTYIKLIYKKNDIFINNTELIKEFDILFTIFMRFITLGKIPNFLEYDDLHKLFDKIQQVNDVNLNVRKETFELIFAHLSRDPNNLNNPYRLTKMKDKFEFVGLLNITYAPISNISKLLGNYLDDGITGAVINDNPQTDDIEQLLLNPI